MTPNGGDGERRLLKRARALDDDDGACFFPLEEWLLLFFRVEDFPRDEKGCLWTRRRSRDLCHCRA
jgi:hypothetical protein